MKNPNNSETRKLQLHSETDSVDLSAFMTKHQAIDLIDRITKTEMPSDLRADGQKIRFLQLAALRFE